MERCSYNNDQLSLTFIQIRSIGCFFSFYLFIYFSYFYFCFFIRQPKKNGFIRSSQGKAGGVGLKVLFTLFKRTTGTVLNTSFMFR